MGWDYLNDLSFARMVRDQTTGFSFWAYAKRVALEETVVDRPDLEILVPITEPLTFDPITPPDVETDSTWGTQSSLQVAAIPSSWVDMTKAPAGTVRELQNDSDPAPAFINLDGPYDRNLVQLKPTPDQFAANTAASDGVVGNAAAATREKGERIFEAIVENSVAFIESIRSEAVTVRNVDIPI